MQRYSKNTRHVHQKVQSFIEQEHLLSPNAKVLAALSGGADSVALLHILRALEYNCVAVHCNFHLRGEESDRDEAFVQKLCAKLEIPLHITHFETIKYAQENRLSIEMAARQLRYNWFYEILKQENAEAIAVAHHADDNIETLLMNLTRGTGLKGLTGIPVRNEKVVRPLLCLERKTIDAYITDNKLEFVVDSTNNENEYLRNKFRNVLLPLLEELNPAVRNTLYNSIERFRGTYDIYARAIDTIRQQILKKENDYVSIDIALLKQQANAETVLYELLQDFGFHADTISNIACSLDGQAGKVFFSEHFRLTKDRDFLIVEQYEQKSEASFFINVNYSENDSPIPIQLKKLLQDEYFLLSKDKNCVHLDLDTLRFPLELRRWKAGDSFYPLGMKQQKKVSDFLIDEKVSRPDKENTWVLLSDNNIVWIVGHRIDNRFKVRPKTCQILEICINNK